MKKQQKDVTRQIESSLSIAICTFLLTIGSISGCGAKNSVPTDITEETPASTAVGAKSTTTTSKVSADQPADSTGAFANLTIGFSTSGAGGAAMPQGNKNQGQ